MEEKQYKFILTNNGWYDLVSKKFYKNDEKEKIVAKPKKKKTSKPIEEKAVDKSVEEK